MQLKSTQQQASKPRCIRGFEHINRYWDKTRERYAAKILPGQYYVTCEDELIVTVLGSCVSACIRDRVFGIGGMNHFMLPVGDEQRIAMLNNADESARYGNFAMEKMINDILKQGGNRENLEVKIFGGGKVLRNMNKIDVGEQNIAFVRGYLQIEKLNLLAADLGDIYPRKVVYLPSTGKVWVKKLRGTHNDTVVQRERRYQSEIKQQPVAGDVELF